MRSLTAKLLDHLTGDGAHHKLVEKPWGRMHELTIESGPSDGDHLLMKEITVDAGHRTSRQFHKWKDEVIIILDGDGHVFCDGIEWVGSGTVVRIKPNDVHRVTGPLRYLELSTNYPTDVVRLHDDYGRTDYVG
jgi:mannose-6-phosphate isomerase